jgi:5'-deoxynucleotidase YfbR-like HD superfamily hydrolase
MKPDTTGVPNAAKCMQTYSGRMVDPLNPEVRDVCIEDISHALALICRYGGHCRQFYSIAQHCVLVSQNVEKGYELEGLLHDSSESYIGDIVRPLKVQKVFSDVYKAIEHAWENTIADRFRLRYPWHPSIKQADNLVLFTEQRDLVNVQLYWNGSEKYTLLKKVINPWGPAKAERKFLERYYQLETLRGAK